MTNRILRSQFLGSTAALSVLLGAINPLPLGAQSNDSNASGNGRLTRENCQNADGTTCSPLEFRQQRQKLQQERAATPDAGVKPAADPAPAPPVEPSSDPAGIVTEPEAAPAADGAAPDSKAESAPAEVPAAEEVPAPDVVPAPDEGNQTEIQDAPVPPPVADPADPEAPKTGAKGTSIDPAKGAVTGPVADPAPVAGADAAPSAEAEITAESVEPLTPTAEAVDALNSLLTDEGDDTGPAPPAAAEVGADPAADATVTTITEADARSSTEEFSDAPVVVGENRRSGLSNLEKVGLVALGALAVGAILNNRGDEVVENSGDRVVVRRNDGNFYVLKDDDALLRQPGRTVETETFSDGSTRSVVPRDDGSRIVTIRDASGRVLRRARVEADGRETLLIDDISPVEPVERIDVSQLPQPRPDFTISTTDDGASLRAALVEIEARENRRAYSLRQIRDIREVRALAPKIQIDPVTFATGSSAIRSEEAEKLSQLGGLLADLIRARPNEVFLIEGHTDAIGSAASNLALSDRRAESVALALTEYFDVPPENLVVQGYGEGDLLIPIETADQRNRRVAVRLITPILRQAVPR
ncbi:MAG: OmpA family protein [Gemmobacter sp.]|nr:OmpA family protein [Gemmobacter sp.]